MALLDSVSPSNADPQPQISMNNVTLYTISLLKLI